MLIVTQERTMIHGTKADIETELCCLIHHLVCSKEILTKEELEFAVSIATLPQDELVKKAEEHIDEMLKQLMSSNEGKDIVRFLDDM